MIRIESKYYDARSDCYFTYGKMRIPTLIIPEWSLRPFGTEEYQQAVARHEVSDAQDIAIKAHERMEAEHKKFKMKPGVWILIGLGALAVIYMIATGAK